MVKSFIKPIKLVCALLIGVGFTAAANATPLLPDAADWSYSITTITDRGSPAATASIANAPGDSVELSYSAATGGSGVGTSTRQYDYVTSADDTGTLALNFDVDLSAFTGYFGNEFQLDVIKNGAVVQNLVPYTSEEPGSSGSFNVFLSLSAGDSWGIRALAGNFDSGSGVAGTIIVSAIPEPGTMILLSSGLFGLAIRRRRLTIA